jgi:hypothetical protein
MRQRFIRILAAVLLVVAGVGATAAVASAMGGGATVSNPDSNSWE